MSRYIILFLLTISVFTSCKERKVKQISSPSDKEINDAMRDINREYVDMEQQQIDDLIIRYGWNTERTGTGLRYQIYEKGDGEIAQNDKIATISYSCSLITGDEIYNSDNDGLLVIKIGKGGAVSGIHEALLYMREGDKAKIIVPSHLGFGLMGDNNKVPMRSTLIYDIELLNISNK